MAVACGILAPSVSAERPPVDIEEGRKAFAQQCARCHGATGGGDGLDAERLFPRPRNLALGVYKFRTTASGTSPTDDDLFRTISEGLPGSGMPAFGGLDEETRWQLVAYVKSLSPVFQENPPQPLELSAEPDPKTVDLAKGRELFTGLGCVACHGVSGRGNGPSALTLTDDWGNAIPAADLTAGWRYRGGREPRDIFARLMAGLDGTPMPSYVDAISKEEGWQVAHYVRSLQREPRWGQTLRAVSVEGALPTAMDDPRWETAPALDVALDGAVYQDGGIVPTHVHTVTVQAVADAEAIVWRLVWHDPSESRQGDSEERVLPDAIALALQPSGVTETVGNLLVWPASDAAPALDLVYWSADGSARQGVVRDVAALAGEPSVGAALESAAAPGVVSSADVVLRDPRQGTSSSSDGQSVARYDDGAWTVVVRRSLRAQPDGATIPTDGTPTPVAFLAWDGGSGETGRVRSASTWINLVVGANEKQSVHGPQTTVH